MWTASGGNRDSHPPFLMMFDLLSALPSSCMESKSRLAEMAPAPVHLCACTSTSFVLEFP